MGDLERQHCTVYTDLIIILNKKGTRWQIGNGEMVFRGVSEALYPCSGLDGEVTAQAVTLVSTGLMAAHKQASFPPQFCLNIPAPDKLITGTTAATMTTPHT